MSFVSDFKNSLTSLQSNAPAAALSSNTNGSACDCLLAEGPIGIFYSVGAVTGTPTSVVLSVQESDVSGSGFANVSSADTSTVDVTAGSVTGFLNLWHRGKRYLRVVVTFTGGSSPTALVTTCVVFNKKIRSTSSGAFTTIQ